MVYKSGTEKDISEIKKQLKPILEIPNDLDKLSKNLDKINKYKEREKAYKKQQMEIKLKKWDDRLNWLTEKINNYKEKKNIGKMNNVVYICGNCNTEVNEKAKYCPKCGSEFVKKEKHTNTGKPHESKTNYYCDKCGNEVSKDATKCNKCNAQFIDEKVPTTFMCGNCHNVIKKTDKCPRCGAWFVDHNIDDDKKTLLKELDKKVRKDNWEKLTKEELAAEIKNIISIMNNNYKEVKKYVSKKSNEFEVRKFIAYQNKIDNLNKKATNIEKKIEKGLNKANSLIEYNKLLSIYTQSIKIHKEMIGGVTVELKVTGYEIRSKNASIISKSKDEGIIDNEYHSSSSNYDDEYVGDSDKKNNEDIVYNELEDWQKGEVEAGNYDSYNFEEDELEEDDYYYEDDKE